MRRRGGGEKEGQRDSQAADGGTHPTLETMHQQHDTPLSHPPVSSDATLSGSASGLLLPCVCVSKSALPCVISHHRCAERSSAFCCALAAFLINPRVMDQVSAAQPSALLNQSGLYKKLQLKFQYKLHILRSQTIICFAPCSLDDSHYT